MKMVRINGSDVDYPRKCACCLQPANKALQIRKEDLKRLAVATVVGGVAAATHGASSLAGRLRSSRAVEVPYCATCLNHVRWARLGGWLGVSLSALVYSFFGAMLGGLFCILLSFAAEDPRSAPNPYLVVVPCVVVAVALALAQLRFKPQGALDRRHASKGKDAVEIARFSSDSIVLKCHNNAFADELLAANPGSAFVDGQPGTNRRTS